MGAARISSLGHQAPWSDARLRVTAAIIGGGLPALLGVAGVVGDLPGLVFAFIGVVPGIMLGLTYGPLAARTEEPVPMVLGLALRSFLVAVALDVAGLLVLAGIQTWLGQPTITGELSLIQNLGWMFFWGVPVVLIAGFPASLVLSFTGVGMLRVVVGPQVTLRDAD